MENKQPEGFNKFVEEITSKLKDVPKQEVEDMLVTIITISNKLDSIVKSENQEKEIEDILASGALNSLVLAELIKKGSTTKEEVKSLQKKLSELLLKVLVVLQGKD